MMPQRLDKEITLAVLFLIATTVAFWFLRDASRIIATGRMSEWSEFIPPVLSLIAASAFFGLCGLFLTNPWVRILSLTAGAVIPYIFLPAWNGILLVLSGSILLSLLAAHRIRQEYTLSLGFSTSKVMRAGLPLYFTVSALILSLYYFVEVRDEDIVPTLLPKPIVDAAIPLFSRIGQTTPEETPVRPDMTVDEFLTLLVRQQLRASGVDEKRVNETEIARMAALERDQIAQRFRVKIAGSDTISDALRNTVIKRAEELLGPWRAYIPYAAAVAVFFAFKTLSLGMYLLALPVAFLLIKLMARATIIISEKQVIEVTRLKL